MKKKIFLSIIVFILTITNFILFKNFYNTKLNNNQTEKYNYVEDNFKTLK